MSIRMRRNRQTKWVRSLVQENRLCTSDLILPLFILEGENTSEPVASLPGVKRYSVDLLVERAHEAFDAGIPAVMLFPVTETRLRDELGTEAFNSGNLICRAIRAVKAEVPEIGIITDVALDPYTTHGHDGVLTADGSDVENDQTVAILCKQAVVQAAAGADIIAPSDMMDGRVAAIRSALDCEGYQAVGIMSYAAKYASAFYGPFRDAVGSASNLKSSKKTYQMNPANINEAIREVQLDIDEGADSIIVKPGLPYLDVLSAVKNTFGLPTISYQVSGEYAMLKAAAANGWLDYDSALMEQMICFKRAGADAIITYAALEIAQLITVKSQ